MASETVVPVESVDVGDIAAFMRKDGDTHITVRGEVADIRRYGRTRVLISPEGKELVSYTLDRPRDITAVMIRRYTPVQPSLFDNSPHLHFEVSDAVA